MLPVSTTMFCRTTVGSTSQNRMRCTPGRVIMCVVAVRLTLAEVAVVTFTICGASLSTEIAYRRPTVGWVLLRGDRYAHTVTGPVVVSVVVYSSRGLLPPGLVTLGVVVGDTSTPAPVRPRSGSATHRTSPGVVAAVNRSAGIDTYPFASTNPRGVMSGFCTTACTVTVWPAG